MGQRPTYEDENGFYSATSLPGSAALSFVISTGAQRSGEISVWMPLLGNVFRRCVAAGSAVPRTFPGNPESSPDTELSSRLPGVPENVSLQRLKETFDKITVL
jgi:hypothetical protein